MTPYSICEFQFRDGEFCPLRMNHHEMGLPHIRLSAIERYIAKHPDITGAKLIKLLADPVTWIRVPLPDDCT